MIQIQIPEPNFNKRDVLEKQVQGFYQGYFQAKGLDTREGLRIIREFVYKQRSKDAKIIVVSHLLNRITEAYTRDKNKVKPGADFHYQSDYQDILTELCDMLEELGVKFEWSSLDNEEKINTCCS